MTDGPAVVSQTTRRGWTPTPLGDLCEFVRGVTFDKTEASPDPRDGCLPILRAGNISEGLDLDNDLVWVPAARVSPQQRLRVGDIAICMSSGSPAVVGKSAPLQQPFLGSVGAFCGIIRARNPRWSEYIALWLRSPVFLEWRDSQARGANIQNLRFSQFESLAIRTPPDHERDAFAGRLRSQLDAAARMRTACEVQATSIAHAESAMIRTAFGAPEVAGVERVALGTLCAIKAPLVDPTLAEYGGLPHVSGENIESGTGRLLEVRSASDDGMMSGKYLFEPGSVLYSKLRPYLRKAAAADFRGLCSADMYPLRPLDDRLDARFLKWLLLSDEFTVYADEESRRARMPKLNRRQLFSWLAPLPSIADQGRIAETLQRRLDAAGVIRVLIEEQAAEICRLPAAILHPAFSC